MDLFNTDADVPNVYDQKAQQLQRLLFGSSKLQFS